MERNQMLLNLLKWQNNEYAIDDKDEDSLWHKLFEVVSLSTDMISVTRGSNVFIQSSIRSFHFLWRQRLRRLCTDRPTNQCRYQIYFNSDIHIYLLKVLEAQVASQFLWYKAHADIMFYDCKVKSMSSDI